uniref:Uncharacterized protein n=1 Tax=Craspedostauros australis TaxID=1486917 RepID=A0A7R9WYR8_9STRA
MCTTNNTGTVQAQNHNQMPMSERGPAQNAMETEEAEMRRLLSETEERLQHLEAKVASMSTAQQRMEHAISTSRRRFETAMRDVNHQAERAECDLRAENENARDGSEDGTPSRTSSPLGSKPVANSAVATASVSTADVSSRDATTANDDGINDSNRSHDTDHHSDLASSDGNSSSSQIIEDSSASFQDAFDHFELLSDGDCEAVSNGVYREGDDVACPTNSSPQEDHQATKDASSCVHSAPMHAAQVEQRQEEDDEEQQQQPELREQQQQQMEESVSTPHTPPQPRRNLKRRRETMSPNRHGASESTPSKRKRRSMSFFDSPTRKKWRRMVRDNRLQSILL